MIASTNHIIKPLIVVFVLVTTAPTFAASTVYVDADATGANNGSSWADAFNHPYNALAKAQAGDEIRVARGIYLGLYFQLINGVSIKGGYAGVGEPDPNARDVEQFETILKGDIDIDYETNFANYSGTGLHVIIGSFTNETAVLDGFTITGGYSESLGGGMYNMGGTPTLKYCKFIRNYATYGGGAISNFDTEIGPIFRGPTLIHCTFIENSCNKWGGAIYNNEASPILINCTFIGNSAKRGGGIHGDSSPSLTNCKFIGNSAWGYEDDDGIWHDGHGGAIYHACCGNLKLKNCTFIANSGISGGALYFRHEPSPKMSECMFIGNLAKNYGGAIYIQDFLYPNLKQCTFADNSAANGNALVGIPSSRFYGKPNILKITNSILWDGGDEIWIDDGSTIEITYSDVEGGWLGEGNIDANPLFVDQGYWDVNGTPDDANDDVWVDGDYHLLTRSPCINAGDPNYIAGPNETDLEGNPRVICGRIDMGAYEFLRAQQIIYVDDDATGANDGSSWVDAYNYLQDALAFACSGDEIHVAQGIYKPDQGAGITPGDRTATFQLINGVTLKGGYAGTGKQKPDVRDIDLYETILSGDLNGNDIDVNDPIDLFDDPCRADNSYHVVTGSDTDETTVLDGFIVTGGNANQDPRSPDYLWKRGGGIYSYSGSPNLMNCTITRNTAVVGGGIENLGSGMFHHLNCNPTIINCAINGNNGGGIRSSGSPTLINCTISGNNGCGMSNGLGNPTLTNCTISGNNDGGWHSCDSYSTLINCVFAGNSSDWNGGAWFSWDSDSVLVNCVFVGNSTSNDGGGIYSTSDYSMTLTNCILWSNRDKGGMDASAQIDGGGNINYCCIQGWTGGLGGTGNIDEDPCFVSLGYWDSNELWIEGDYHLLPDSPCIDTGDPNYIAEPNETDLEGKPRVIGDRIDMGAYEYSPTVPAEVRIVPRTINLASKGNWITSYIWLPDEYVVADIEPNSIFLEDEIQPEQFLLNEDQQLAMAKFDRDKVQAILDTGEIELKITGQLADGTVFEAADTIKVIDKTGK